jgi:nucleoside-diphosphate-sugar epimerase
MIRKLGPQAVVHAALDRDVYARDDERIVRRPLENVLEGLSGLRTCRVLLVGSAWILASGKYLDESAPLGPVNAYARNKALEERVLAELTKRAVVPWITLRLFNLFGRHESPTRLIPTLVTNLQRREPVALTHGEQVRDFNDVDAVSRAFVDALAAPETACGRTYHIGSGVGTSVRELALRVATMVGGRELIRFGGAEAQDESVPILVSNPSLASEVLGWDPGFGALELRLRETVEWWLAQRRPLAAREVSA